MASYQWLNQSIKNGKIKQAKGKAKVIDKNSNAKLKVTFFWPFYGDYWIIKLGNDYDYLCCRYTNLKYLWILSRTPQIDDELYSQLIEYAKSKGFEVNKLIKNSSKSITPRTSKNEYPRNV